jgi:hypothetical protein
MVSTWMVLATDLGSLDTGNQFITDNVDTDLVEFTWVIRTSDILKFEREKLQYIVLGFDDFDVEPIESTAELVDMVDGLLRN